MFDGIKSWLLVSTNDKNNNSKNPAPHTDNLLPDIEELSSELTHLQVCKHIVSKSFIIYNLQF